MAPLVIVGGGPKTYQLLMNLKESKDRQPLLLVGEKFKVFDRRFLGPAAVRMFPLADLQLDLWSLCCRLGVEVISDEATHWNRKAKRLYLRDSGSIEFDRMLIETDCIAKAFDDPRESPSVMRFKQANSFLQQWDSFLKEVHRHCPREVRVVLIGCDRATFDLATILNQELQKSCQLVEIVILTRQEDPILSRSFLKNFQANNIRLHKASAVTGLREHRLEMADGKTIDFDVCIPMERWQGRDKIGSRLQNDRDWIFTDDDLSLPDDDNVFVVGDNVLSRSMETPLSQFEESTVIQTITQNFINGGEARENLKKCFENPETNSLLMVRKNSLFGQKPTDQEVKTLWYTQVKEEMQNLRKRPLHAKVPRKISDDLEYEASHMSRPWRGMVNSREEKALGTFRLTSFNGFNTWGDPAQSARQIVEMALLKSFVGGLVPEQLRFHLTLPRNDGHLTSYVFESTFRAIEAIAEQQGVEIGGGDTYDGNHWHLSITIGGRLNDKVGSHFADDDYIILTRPLGFGYLWANRHAEDFDSDWIRNTYGTPIYSRSGDLVQFRKEFGPSAMVVIEEWGLVYQAMQSLKANQQILLNFREVPRWGGVDELVDMHGDHPGLAVNWQRIVGEVGFNKDEVSRQNGVLWDSLSQGGLLIGVKATNHQQALSRLREMGYKRAAVVGCVRAQSGQNKNRVLLSDWIPG